MLDSAVAAQSATARVEGADALRGIAASGVVLHHLSHLVYKAPDNSLGIISSHLGLGVPLFFCISAFSMYQAYYNRESVPGFIPAFWVRRYARLLPLFLVLFIAWSVPPFGRLSSIPIESIPVYLTMLFAVIPSYSTGYVPAAWSLGVEMLFYIAFPLMIVTCRNVITCSFGLVVSLVLAYNMQSSLDAGYVVNQYYHAINPVLFIPCFFVGAIVWLAFQKNAAPQPLPLRKALFLFVTIAVLVVAWKVSIMPLSALAGKKALGYGFTVGCFLVAFAVLLYCQTTRPSRVFVNSVTKFLGKISYSLYLLHPLVLVSLNRFLAQNIKSWPQNDAWKYLELAVLTFIILLPLAYLTYRFVEMPFIKLGAKYAKRIEEFHGARTVLR